MAVKVVGITGGTLTVGGVDFEIESGTLKIEQEKIEYVPIGGTGWVKMYPGGKKKVTGNIKGAIDTDLMGSGPMPAPLNITAETSFSLAIGPYLAPVHTISGNCVVTDWDIKSDNKGLSEFSANFESSGLVTYA